MKRKDFLHKSGLLASMGLIATNAFSDPTNSPHPNELKPVLLPPMPPLKHNGGMNIRTWVRSEMTGGVFSNVETAVAPKRMGPPPHYHKELDELMYVIEGTASVLVGSDIVEVKAGGWHLRPRLIQHTFWNASNTPLLFMDMYFNQPFEQYLEKIFFELTEKNGFPEGSEAKMKELNSLNKKFGVVFSDTSFKDFEDIKKRFDLK
jgi:mannose-6-phosphate isomerase-like protein (cupin superfamily)